MGTKCQILSTRMESSHRVLSALELIVAHDGSVARGAVWSLADFHLGPMMAYLTATPEGERALVPHAKLSAWWEAMSRRRSLRETDPGLPDWRQAPWRGLR